MFKNPILLTIITCGIFFFFATATSQERDFLEPFQINGTVELVDSNIVIANNDTINITNAFLTLDKPTGDSLNGSPITVSYFADGFNLNMGATDTFPMSVFKIGDTLAYPIDTFPHRFDLQFGGIEGNGSLEVFF